MAGSYSSPRSAFVFAKKRNKKFAQKDGLWSLDLFTLTTWKVSKYGVFSGPYLDTFHTVILIKLQKKRIYTVRKAEFKILIPVDNVSEQSFLITKYFELLQKNLKTPSFLDTFDILRLGRKILRKF